MNFKSPKTKAWSLPDEITKAINEIIKDCSSIKEAQYWICGDIEKHKVFTRTVVQCLVSETPRLDALFMKYQIGYKDGVPQILVKNIKPNKTSED